MEGIILAIVAIYIIAILGVFSKMVQFVYLEAKKNKMNYKMWVLLVFILPAFSGFFCYLLIRKQYNIEKENDNTVKKLVNSVIGLIVFPILVLVSLSVLHFILKLI